MSEACQVESPQLPNIDSSTNFENAELAAQFNQLGLEILTEKETNDDPPAKRRKIFQDDDLFDQTASSLYSLLGAQKATDLDGLSQIAE